MNERDAIREALKEDAELRREEQSVDVLATYTLQLIGPLHGREFRGIAQPLLDESEENLTDLLPPGYRVEIKEWSDE